MTSLIDVIFLLLLFFMLSSTFSRFAEVEIGTGGGQSAAAAPSTATMLFLRVGADDLSLNGRAVSAEVLATDLASAEDATLLISITNTTTAQRLTDVLVIARAVPDLPVVVLEAS